MAKAPETPLSDLSDAPIMPRSCLTSTPMGRILPQNGGGNGSQVNL